VCLGGEVAIDMRAVRAARKSLPIIQGAFNLWLERNAFQHAGALAFYTLFSLAPLIIIVVAIVGIVLGDDAARGQVSAEIKDLVGSQAAEAVEEAVRSSRMKEGGLLPTLIGLGTLLFGATTVFAQMQTSLNEFWGVVARPSRSGVVVFITSRLLSLGLVLIIGFLLLTSFIVSMSIVALIKFASAWIPIPPFAVAAIDAFVSLGVATMIFATIFKMLPDVQLQWRDMWKAGALTALLFVAGQYLISWYLTTMAPASTYGAAASLVIVLLWVYYSALIILFGAAISKMRMLHRGEEVVPKTTAARIAFQVFEGETERNLHKVATID
jgi:membrane protein